MAIHKESQSFPKSFFMKLYNTVKFDLFHSSEIDQKEPGFKKMKSEN